MSRNELDPRLVAAVIKWHFGQLTVRDSINYLPDVLRHLTKRHADLFKCTAAGMREEIKKDINDWAQFANALHRYQQDHDPNSDRDSRSPMPRPGILEARN